MTSFQNLHEKFYFKNISALQQEINVLRNAAFKLNR